MKAEKKNNNHTVGVMHVDSNPFLPCSFQKTCAPPLKVRISSRRQRLTGALQITMVGRLFPKDSAGWSLGMRKEG